MDRSRIPDYQRGPNSRPEELKDPEDMTYEEYQREYELLLNGNTASLSQPE